MNATRNRAKAPSVQLDTRAELQSSPAPTTGQDGYGSVAANAWPVLRTLWVSIEPISGAETVIGDQVVGIARFRLVTRGSCATFRTDQRLRILHGPYDGAILYVEAAAAFGERRENLTELLCRWGRPVS